MEVTRSVKSLKVYGSGRRISDWDIVIQDNYYELFVNKKEVGEVIAIPHLLKEAVIGLMVCKGMIESKDTIQEIKIKEDKIEVTASQDFEERKEALEQGFEEGNQFPKVRSEYKIHEAKILEKARNTIISSNLFECTRGTFSASLSDGNGFNAFAEDVSLMTAIYKVIGKAISKNFDFSKSVLIVSGTIDAEMVLSVAKAGIPIIASLSAPTTSAIEISRETNQTIVGFIEKDSFKVFNKPERVDSI